VGSQVAEDQDGQSEEGGKDQAREYPSDEELSYGLLGQDPVDDEDGARGDQDPEGGGGGYAAGGQGIVVAIALHLGIGDLSDGGHRRPRRTTDRCEPRTGHHRGDGEPTPELPEGVIGCPIEPLADPGGEGIAAHQYESRNHGEGIGVEDGKEVPYQELGPSGGRREVTVTDPPHEGHGEGDGHPEHEKQEQKADTYQAHQNGIHLSVPRKRPHQLPPHHQ